MGSKMNVLITVLACIVSQAFAAMVPVPKGPPTAAMKDTSSKTDPSGLAQNLPSSGEAFAGVNLVASDSTENSPDMTKVSVIAIACIVGVVLLDMLAHFLEQYVSNEEDREALDCMVDGVAAILLFLIAGLWCGILSEYVLTCNYSTGRFPSMAFVVLSNKLIIIPIVGAMMAVAGQLACDPQASMLASVPGLLAGVEAIIGEKALLYITFPVASVFKSTAVIPTMIMNALMNGEYAALSEYAVAAFISLCVVGFSLANSKDGSAPYPNMELGISMMVVFLILCSFLGVAQKKIFNLYPNFTTLQMMMISSLWSAAFSSVVVQTSTGVAPLLEFLQNNPECGKHLLFMGLTGTLHLYLLFYIVKHQGPVMLTVVGCLEKITSILLSSVLYDHPLSTLARLCALGACLGALGITFLGMRRKRREAALKHTGHLRAMFRATASMRGFSHPQQSMPGLAVSKAQKEQPYGTFDGKAS